MREGGSGSPRSRHCSNGHASQDYTKKKRWGCHSTVIGRFGRAGGVDARGITAPQRRCSTGMAMDTKHSNQPAGGTAWAGYPARR